MSTTVVPPQRSEQEECPVHCTLRLTFWIVAASSWVVWIFAAAAAADDKWLSDNWQGEWLAPGEDRMLSLCDDVDDGDIDDDDGGNLDEVCGLYRGLTAAQFIATIVCSVAVVLLAVAFFRPAVGGCASVRTLAFVGSALIVTYALFQLVAVSLAGAMKQEFNKVADESETTFLSSFTDSFTPFQPGYDADLGPSFAVAVSGLILGVIVVVLLLLSARHAGEGPLYSCCSSLMLANRNAGDTHKAGGGGDDGNSATLGQGSQPEPLATAAGTAAVASTAEPPPYHHEEAGLPPPPQTTRGSAVAEQRQQQQQQEEKETLPSYDDLPAANP